MSKLLYESFSWMRSDLTYAGPNGNKAQFKGIALIPTISGNGRRYVTDELHRSARTLVGKRVDLNHNSQKIKGNVTWAEYENDAIEYVMEIKDAEYVQKLRDRQNLTKEVYIKKWGRDPIYGVSVDANYRYHDEECRGGQCIHQPHGIIFNALSLVEDPERPGVAGTTIELLETQSPERRISEALVRDLVPLSIRDTVLTENKNMTTQPPKKLKEEECEKGKHMNDKGECVPDEAIFGKEDAAKEIKKLPLTEIGKLKLGEPFAGYTDFADCVSQNSDKGNPEAYCGTIKKQTEETQCKERLVAETVNSVIGKLTEVDANQKQCCNKIGEAQKKDLEQDAFIEKHMKDIGNLEAKVKTGDSTYASKTALDEVAKNLPSFATIETINGLKQTFTEKLEQTASKTQLTDIIAKLPNIEESLKPIHEALAKIPALEKQLADSDKKYSTLNTVYEALNRKHSESIRENEAKKLKETQQTDEKLKPLLETMQKLEKKIIEQDAVIDTLKLHVPANFKVKNPEAKPAQEPAPKTPYQY